jgi:hypothetical protein
MGQNEAFFLSFDPNSGHFYPKSGEKPSNYPGISYYRGDSACANLIRVVPGFTRPRPARRPKEGWELLACLLRPHFQS